RTRTLCFVRPDAWASIGGRFCARSLSMSKPKRQRKLPIQLLLAQHQIADPGTWMEPSYATIDDPVCYRPVVPSSCAEVPFDYPPRLLHHTSWLHGSSW